MSATLCIQDKYLCYQCKSACDIHGRSCRNGLMFPVLLLMGGISKCPNYEFDTHIDWEEVRIKAAISALQGFCSNSVTFNNDGDKLAKWSVSCADALIAELKKGGEK